jgi:hypothetical protein
MLAKCSPLCIRYRSCANGLNRSCKQIETALDRRLARDLPEVPQAQPEPVNDLPDADARHIIEIARKTIEGKTIAQAIIANRRNHATTPLPTSGKPRSAQASSQTPTPTTAMLLALRQMGASPSAAPGAAPGAAPCG